MFFKRTASMKLDDPVLQRNMKTAKGKFVDGRAKGILEIDNWEDIRTYAAAMRDRTIASLDAYLVEFERNARKELLALPVAVRERIMEAVQRLAVDPFKSVNVKSLNGGVFRLRVGDYRVIFLVKTEVLIVLVIKIGHRREVYRF